MSAGMLFSFFSRAINDFFFQVTSLLKTISLIPCYVFLIHDTKPSSDILSTLINAIILQLLMLVLIPTNDKVMTVMFLPLFRYNLAVIDKLRRKLYLHFLKFSPIFLQCFISYVDFYYHYLSSVLCVWTVGVICHIPHYSKNSCLQEWKRH